MVFGEGQCQDRFGSYNVSIFRRRQCTLCYSYLFPRGKSLEPLWKNMEYLVSTNLTYLSAAVMVAADTDDAGAVTQICETLSEEECERWRSCCVAAQDCCRRQLGQIVLDGPGYCPRRWDGFGCWDATPAGTSLSMYCPTFIKHSIPTSKHYTCVFLSDVFPVI